jgi:hypothetical protein
MSDGKEGVAEQTGWEKRLKWVIGIRLLVAILFLGSAAAIQLTEELPYPTGPLFSLLAPPDQASGSVCRRAIRRRSRADHRVGPFHRGD